MLDVKNLKDEELSALLENEGSPEELILKELITRALEKDILFYLLEYCRHFDPVPKILFGFWDKYRQLSPSNFELGCIIANFPALRTEAAIMLCGRPNLVANDYKVIIQFSEANRDEAESYLWELSSQKRNLEVSLETV